MVIPDEDRDRFVFQARREGVTLSAWLRAAAHQRLERRMEDSALEEVSDLDRFFAECDEREGSEREPDWEEHLAVITASRLRGASPA